MNAIDVHSHIVPADFPVAPASCAANWPRTVHRPGDQAMIMMGSKEFRLVDHRCWDVERRVADMNSENVEMHVLSPMPELLSYWIDALPALELSRHINGVIAEMVAKKPSRFCGLGMIPLQDPDLAAKELSVLKNDYGLRGIEIGTSINGRPPGDPMFDIIFAEAERLDLCVFIHALHPPATDRVLGAVQLLNFILYPTDVGLAAASLITTNILGRHPKLRVGFSHGGGTLPGFIHRMDSGWKRFESLNTKFEAPLRTAKRFYYDNVVYDRHYLRHLTEVFGISQIFVGSDYPFNGAQENSAAMFDEMNLSPEDMAKVRFENAARFLNIEFASN
jgi:aminocarboxymuconate-semialdehyde decarboxylase